MSIFSVNLSSVDAQLDNVKPLAKILLDTSGSMGYVCDENEQCKDEVEIKKILNQSVCEDHSRGEVLPQFREIVEEYCNSEESGKLFYIIELSAGELVRAFASIDDGSTFEETTGTPETYSDFSFESISLAGITLNKKIINDDGGTSSIGDFELFLKDDVPDLFVTSRGFGLQSDTTSDSSSSSAAILRFEGNTGNFVEVFREGDTVFNYLILENENIFASGFDSYLPDESSRYESFVIGEKLDGYNGNLEIGFEPATVPRALGLGEDIGFDGNLYVINGGIDSIVKFNISTGKNLGTVVSSLPDDASDIEFGPDSRLYVLLHQKVVRYDASTGVSLGTFTSDEIFNTAQGMTFGPDGDLYISGVYDSKPIIVRHDGTSGAYIETIVSGSTFSVLGDLVFGPDGYIYVTDGHAFDEADSGNGSVFKIDSSRTFGPIKHVSTGDGGLTSPLGITFGPSIIDMENGNEKFVISKTYSIDDSDITNYSVSFEGDCNSDGSITVDADENKECTVIYDDISTVIDSDLDDVDEQTDTYVASDYSHLFDALSNILDDLLQDSSERTTTTTTERTTLRTSDDLQLPFFKILENNIAKITKSFSENDESQIVQGGYFFDDIKLEASSVIPDKSGVNQYYIVKDITHSSSGGQSTVRCDEGDILKGGGFARGSGSIVGTSVPNKVSGAWSTIGDGPHSTYGICLDNPPKRASSQTMSSQFETLVELRRSLDKISDYEDSDSSTVDPTKIAKAKDIVEELRDSSSSSTIAGRINPSELWKLKEINEQFVQTDELREKIATLQSENVLDIPDPNFIDTIEETEREITITKKTELDLTTAAQYDLIFDQSVVDTFDGLEQTENIDITPDEKYLDERLAELAELHDDIDIDELRQDVLDKKGAHVIEEQIVIKKNLFVPENLALDPSEFLLTKQSLQNEIDYSDYLSIYATGDGSSPSGAEPTSSDSSSGVTKSTGTRITTSAEYSHTFLNGFTLGNNYEWSWNKKWETSRGFEIAYVGISAELTYGFGLRVPFEVTATIDDDEHSPSDKDDTYFNIDYTIDTLNLTGEQMGDLGLPKSKQFDGKEFVLEFGAQANLKVRLLEKTIIDKQIGDIIDKGSNFETPLGSKTAEIADIEIDGNLIGLVYTTGILKIMLDVGLIVDLGSDGIVMDVSPINSSGGGEITFSTDGETISEEYKVKTVHFFSGDADYVEFGTILDDVEYLPEVLLTPKTRLTGVIETGVFGEYTISTPWIEVYTFEIDLPALGTHDGTVGELEVGTGKMYKTFKMGYGPDEFIGKPSSTPSSFSPTK